MQSADQPKKISIPFAEDSPNRRPIPNESQIGVVDGAASYTDGFPPVNFVPVPQGGIPPAGADFNGVLYEMSSLERWLCAGGQFKYDAEFSEAIGGYPVGSILQRSGGVGAWLNVVENNTTDPDGGSAVGWVDAGSEYVTRFATIADMLSANTTGRKLVEVYEYASGYGTEGGGLFSWVANSTATADDFVTFSPAGNPPSGRWVRTGYGRLNAKMAGCRASFATPSDDTARAQFAIDYVVANGGALEFTYGRYLVDTLIVRRSLYTTMFICDGAYFEARSNANVPAIWQIIGCVDLHLTGVWRFNGANKPNYRAGLSLTVDPDNDQPTTRVNMENLTFRNCGIGISNGVYTNDFQCSEITVYGANFFQTPCPVYNGGSNSGLQFAGGNITSERNTSFPAIPEVGIWSEGGFVKLAGGSLVTNPTGQCGVLLTPCQSALYSGNLYGTVDVTGSHVEVNTPLLNIANPRSFATTASDQSSAKFINNTGYAGGDVAQDFIYVGQATYEGFIEVRGNNWYSSNPRTGYNISGLSRKARVSIDKTSFGKNFRNWLGGVYFCKVIHDPIPIISVSNLAATYVAGSTNTLKFTAKNVDFELSHYQEWYNPSTGVLEIPPGGFSSLTIQCNIVGTGSVSADMFVRRTNGGVSSMPAYGVFNGVGSLSATLHNLVGGETIEIRFAPRGADYVTDNGSYNTLQISAATR